MTVGDPHHGQEPPRLLRFLARLVIRGRDAAYIVSDLDASYARDVERGVGRGRASRRYAWNVVASGWSVWTAGWKKHGWQGIALDAKLGMRMLAKQPLITAVAVVALGLGIPASLSVLHGVDVIYSDFPVPDGDRVVGVRHFDLERRDAELSTLHDYERWMELASLESIGAARSYAVNVNPQEAGATPVRAARITASSFDVLQARPLLGRVLDVGDELDGAPDVVLLGEDLWSARFARDPDIVGRSVRIGRTPHTVVGIMPSEFGFPAGDQVWLPFDDRALDHSSGEGPRSFVFGRLAEDIEVEHARVELTALTERRASDDAERFEHLVAEVVDMPILLLRERNDGILEAEGVMVQAVIFALLMVVCGNVGTLILARTAARSAEITIRTALGASRGRILTQFFVEALLLAVTATGLGLVAANAFAAWVMGLIGPYNVLPYWVDLTLTPRIVAIALGLAVLCAVVAGVLPTLAATRRAIQPNLQRAAARGGSVRFGVGPSLLIVGEIVLAMGFLAFGVTRIKSQLETQRAGLGFDADRYVIGTLAVPDLNPAVATNAPDSTAPARHVATTQQALLARLAEDPAVRGVAMGANVPGQMSANRDVILETPPVGYEPVEWDTSIPRVDVSFFAGLNRPILAGRDFNAGDVDGPPGTRHTAVIVNEPFVRHVLGGRNAVGQRFRYKPQGNAWGALDEGEWYEIVGVVGPFGTNPRNMARDAAIYHPLAPGEINPIRYAVEVAGDAEAFAPRFRQIAASVNPEATVDVNLLGNHVRTESRIFGALFLLVMALAGAGVLLSATGLYALMSFTVSQRTREIGIRTALGARSADIVSTVARRAVWQVGSGLGLGVMWGWVLLNNSSNQVDVNAGNIPLTLAVTAAFAGLVCVLACAHPTLRGLRIQPTEALRES